MGLQARFPNCLDALLGGSPYVQPSHAPHLAVALSGGADSMALVLLADAYARARGGRITALTVDHRLRAESTAEAQQVAGWMNARGIAHYILTPPHTDVSNNVQEAARHWRYDALAGYCAANHLLHCLVAHHAGDQRETVALHHARGATADGGSGMACVRHYRGVRFLRPLLGIEKEALLHYLHACAAPWVDDPSNENTDFARVRVRRELAADASRAVALLQQSRAEGAARAARDNALAVAAMRCVTIHPLGYADLSMERWRALADPLATQLLADVLTTISGATQRPRAADTRRLAEAMRGEAMKCRTLHGCEVVRHPDCFRVAREAARVALPVQLVGKGQLYWDGRFYIGYDLPPGEGYTLAALGTKSQKTLSHALPFATPAITHLDEAPHVPHMATGQVFLPGNGAVRIRFNPAKPLAAAPFWWLK